MPTKCVVISFLMETLVQGIIRGIVHVTLTIWSQTKITRLIILVYLIQFGNVNDTVIDSNLLINKVSEYLCEVLFIHEIFYFRFEYQMPMILWENVVVGY